MEQMVAQLNARITNLENVNNLQGPTTPLTTTLQNTNANITQITEEIERVKSTAEKVITDNAQAQADINTKFAEASRDLDNRLQQAVQKISDTFVELNTTLENTRTELVKKASETEIKFATGEQKISGNFTELEKKMMDNHNALNQDVENKIEKLKMAGVQKVRG